MNTDKPEEAAKVLSESIQKLTYSHFEISDCEKIEKLIELNKQCFIYFGMPEDIEKGGHMAHLNMVASFDNFNNPYD